MKSIVALGLFLAVGGVLPQPANALGCVFAKTPSPEFIDNRNSLASSVRTDLPGASTMVRIVVDPAVHQCKVNWYPLLGKYLTLEGPTAFYLLDVDTATAKHASMLLLAYLRGEGVSIKTEDVESGTKPGVIAYGVIKSIRLESK